MASGVWPRRRYRRWIGGERLVAPDTQIPLVELAAVDRAERQYDERRWQVQWIWRRTLRRRRWWRSLGERGVGHGGRLLAAYERRVRRERRQRLEQQQQQQLVRGWWRRRLVTAASLFV